MRRALLVLALVWVPFLSIFGFAAIGDSSHPHIAFHLVAIPLLVGAFVVLRRLRRDGGRTVRVVAAVLLVTVALASPVTWPSSRSRWHDSPRTGSGTATPPTCGSTARTCGRRTSPSRR